MKLLKLITVMSLFTATGAFAGNERIMNITSDAYPGESFSMSVSRDDDGSVKSLTVVGTDVRTYSLAQLRSPQVVLAASGHNVVLVSVKSDFTAEKGGHADIKYLTNGMTNSYKVFHVLIDIGKDIVVRGPSGPFTKVFMKKATFLGKTIGVSKIVPSP